MLVIAMGYKRRPYVRAVVKDAEKSVILCNPDIESAARCGLSEGIGFPFDHVFKFDSALSESLIQAWGARDLPKLERLWKTAEPYVNTHASRG